MRNIKKNIANKKAPALHLKCFVWENIQGIIYAPIFQNNISHTFFTDKYELCWPFDFISQIPL